MPFLSNGQELTEESSGKAWGKRNPGLAITAVFSPGEVVDRDGGTEKE